MTEYGPRTAAGQAILHKKYAQRGEDWRAVSNRVSSALADNSDHYHAARRILLDQRFLPGGRILAGAGTSKSVCLHNCFVSGTIEDSFVDGRGSIMDRAKEAATTMRMGGGIGYDFSTLRPRGDTIRKLGSTSSGPVSFMHIFNAVCLATCSSGHRRGAQMGILRVDHPDIEEFIHAKEDQHSLTGFNISVAVTDEFMRAVDAGAEFPLRFGGQVYRTINAGTLWEQIMRAAWDWAEPGIIFIDRMNADNNLGYCEQIAATNPCSEQPLPPYGACLLGSFNLPRYLLGGSGAWEFDLSALHADMPHIIRAMDNVNDVARYPLYEQEKESQQKRRMGIGVMGLANAIEAIGFPYGSEGFIQMTHTLLIELKNAAYAASAALAAEKGPFPLFNRDEYLERPYIKHLGSATRDLIALHGIRNSHLISMAPTGTIALVADNVSSGIEPTFAERAENTYWTEEGPQKLPVVDYGVQFLGTRPRCSADVSADEHINVLCCAQSHTDSAVSKTCNVTGRMPWHEFKALYQKAWRRGAKSCSVFNADGKRMGVLTAAESETLDPSCPTGTCDI
jgi:ribonucleoside-diphosphate reductase alpha chain